MRSARIGVTGGVGQPTGGGGGEKGFHRGELKGRLEGQVATLARQLSRRFGPWSEETRSRLDAATQEQLEHGTDRVLDARTLAEVFQGH
jgi:hypothetical protein